MLRLRLSQLWTLFLAGVLSGTILAAAALPAYVLLAVGLKSAGAQYEDLPQDLRTPPTAQRSYLYANDGRTLITSFYDENRTDVPLAEVALVMRQATVAAEDARFYEHGGVDVRGVLRAFVANKVGGGGTAGRLDADHAVRPQRAQERPRPDRGAARRGDRHHAGPQAPGDAVRAGAGAAAVQGRDPEPLPEHRLLRCRGVRHRRRQPAVLLASRPGRADPGRGGPARRPGALAGRRTARSAATPRRRWTGAGTCCDPMVGTGAITAETATAGPGRTVDAAARRRTQRLRGDPRRAPDWGFFCDYFRRWWTAQPAFGAHGRPSGSRRCAGAATASSPRSTRPSRPARCSRPSRCTATPTRRAHADGGGAARHRPGAGAGGEPALRAGPQSARPGELSEHRQPVGRRGRGHRRLPGRLDVQDLHHAGRAGVRHAAAAPGSSRRPSC